MQFQAEEDKKHIDSLNDLVEKLQNKNRVFKKQLDEAVKILSYLKFSYTVPGVSWKRDNFGIAGTASECKLAKI